MNVFWATPRAVTFGTLALFASAFLAAHLTQSSGLLSLTPPDSTTPDAVGKEFALYASAYTAWVALFLLIPAYVFIWFRTHYDRWLASWTASYVAYLVHLAVSAFWFFEGDFAAMTSSSRVSAFWPGMLIMIWWGVDILLAARKATGRGVTAQRIGVHVLVLVLFVGGSAVKGETALIQLMGWALLGAGAGSAVAAYLTHRKLV